MVETIGPLIKAIGIFLKAKLGIDLEKLFQWLGLTWDNEKTKANQAVCYPLWSNNVVTGLTLGRSSREAFIKYSCCLNNFSPLILLI